MKNGVKSSTRGLLDGDLDVSISDAIEHLTIKLSERYEYKTELSETDIKELTNPKLIAFGEAINAFTYSSFTNIPKIMINTSNVTSMESMFTGCQSLKSLDLSNFDTSRVESMRSMFKDCTNLEILDISNFDAPSYSDYCMRMFKNCQNLKFIILNNKEVKFKIGDFDMLELNSTCKFLVPRDSIEKYKNTPEWSNYKDRFEPIENYEIKRDNGSVSVVGITPPKYRRS